MLVSLCAPGQPAKLALSTPTHPCPASAVALQPPNSPPVCCWDRVASGHCCTTTAFSCVQGFPTRNPSAVSPFPQVAPYLHDRGAYNRARTEGGTHGYVTAEGVVVGPPGVADMAAFAAGKPVLK